MSEPAGTFEEWRVHGQPGSGYPPYEFVWSRRLTPAMKEDPEVAARRFVDQVANGPGRSAGIRAPWDDGPHLQHRTVVIGEWATPTPTPRSPCPPADS